MRHPALFCLLLAGLSGVAACRGMYYSTMEVMGREKRDILVERVEDGRDAQVAAKEQFEDTLTVLNQLTGAAESTELEERYEKLKDAYDVCESRAKKVRERIGSIKTVGEDLFMEWGEEVASISSTSLRTGEEETLREARTRFDELIAKMDIVDASMQPVLTAFRDRVLVLKSRLNAQAIASLEGTSVEINDEVTELVALMQASIDEAEEYIAAEARA